MQFGRPRPLKIRHRRRRAPPDTVSEKGGRVSDGPASKKKKHMYLSVGRKKTMVVDKSHGLPALSRVWQHIKLSDVSLGTLPRYSLVVDEDVKKPNNQQRVSNVLK